MNYNTIINIYYKHRLKKAKKIRYILLKIFLPFIYLINKLFDQKNQDLQSGHWPLNTLRSRGIFDPLSGFYNVRK